MDMTVITQLYCQLYITYQLRTLMIILHHIVYCVDFSDNCIHPDDDKKLYWPKHAVDIVCVIDNIVVLWLLCPCIIVSLCYMPNVESVAGYSLSQWIRISVSWPTKTRGLHLKLPSEPVFLFSYFYLRNDLHRSGTKSSWLNLW